MAQSLTLVWSFVLRGRMGERWCWDGELLGQHPILSCQSRPFPHLSDTPTHVMLRRATTYPSLTSIYPGCVFHRWLWWASEWLTYSIFLCWATVSTHQTQAPSQSAFAFTGLTPCQNLKSNFHVSDKSITTLYGAGIDQRAAWIGSSIAG